MSDDHVVRCRHCGVGLNVRCDEDEQMTALRERLAAAERERDEAREAEGKWWKEIEAACELMERYRSIVQAALNEPPEYHYDHHDNGNWSAEHAAHAIRALFTQRDEARRDAAATRELITDARTALMLALDDVPGWTRAANGWLARWPSGETKP